jgi:hypothetical protein
MYLQMACAWSADNTRLATASLDCTVKLCTSCCRRASSGVLNDSCVGDIETRKTLSTHTFGSGAAHQQTGIVYSGAAPVSLSSSGALNVLDERVQGVARVVEGPQKALTAAAATSSSTFLAGAADGRVLQYSTAEHSSKILEGEGHASLVAGIAAAAGKAASVAYDDKIKEIDGASFVCVAAAALHVRMGAHDMVVPPSHRRRRSHAASRSVRMAAPRLLRVSVRSRSSRPASAYTKPSQSSPPRPSPPLRV